MKHRIYTALGLMSGTSLDGIDASIIRTDGQSQYKSILDKYYKYSPEIPEMINKIKSKLKDSSFKYKLHGPVSIFFTNNIGVFPIKSKESL